VPSSWLLMKKYVVLLATAFLLAAPVSAQDVNHDGLVTFLIPINVPVNTPGAYGTLWRSELWIHNGFVSPTSFYPCSGSPCLTHPPGTTEHAFPAETASSIGPIMLSVGTSMLADFHFSSRLVELSRRAQPAGVHMPVVREDHLFTQSVLFLGINGSSNRVAIRVYDPRRRRGSQVKIEVIDANGSLKADTVLTLHYTDPPPPLIPAREPGYIAIHDLAATLPQLASVPRYDIRVTPLTANMEFWALVSVTDIETQHVLLVTAH
jgi:hypothetical protein